MTMTKTEAIELLEEQMYFLTKNVYKSTNETDRERKLAKALNMAIKALEKQFLCEMCEYEEGDFWEMCQFY